MARFNPSPPPRPISIKNWLGVNESVGLTELKAGEALRQVNFRITKDYKLQKREGHNTFVDFENTKNVQGMWAGSLGGHDVIIACNNGFVYKISPPFTKTKISELIVDGNAVIAGTITDAPTSIIYFQSKLLFYNGTDIKEYDGTTYQDIVPYTPTLYVACNPDLSDFSVAKNMHEQENLLTGKRKIEYQGNGTATEYQLPEYPIDGNGVVITINGAIQIENTDFTVDRTLGKITWLVAPTLQALVIIEYFKATAGNEDLVKKNKYCMAFGPGNDTSVFLWGGPQINRRCWCAALNASYFPVNNETYIGTNEYAITDIKAQNANYMIIFKQNRTHYSLPELITLPTGLQAYDYPVYDLNESVGNDTFNAVQMVKDNALSIDTNAWHLWSTTAVESQRSEDVISQRLETSLSLIDLTVAKTFNYKAKFEYWCNVGSVVYIWNYGNNTVYTFDNINGTCFLDIQGIVYYGSQGTIECFCGYSDNGIATNPQMDTGNQSFGGINLIKSSDNLYLELLPASNTSANLYFRTNKQTEWKKVKKQAFYSLLDFNNINFNKYSFLTNRQPQTFSLEYSSNDFTTIQFRIENDEISEPCTILGFLISAEVQGEV